MSLNSIFLPKLKGKDENKKNKNLVYSIPCMDCDKVYIGETSRIKDTRINEHKAKVKSLSSDSKIVEHILEHNPGQPRPVVNGCNTVPMIRVIYDPLTVQNDSTRNRF